MRVSWIKGPREVEMIREAGKQPRPVTGKNGGPVIKQSVVKVLTPRTA